MCEAATMGARHVQGSYKGCEACVRQLQGVREACARQLQCARHLQGVRGMCKAATKGARHVQGSYKGCEACARQLQGMSPYVSPYVSL